MPGRHKRSGHDDEDAARHAENLLLVGLNIRASLFHLGQYCDSWQASLSGCRRAGFHLVLHGPCWLHVPDAPPVPLAAGEAVFFFRDTPHRLTPAAERPDFGRPLPRHEMQPLAAGAPDGTGLVCGFLDVEPGLSNLIASTLPAYIVLRAGDPRVEQARTVLSLIAHETRQAHPPSRLLIEKLVELLLVYTLRHHAPQAPGDYGLLRLARDPVLARLLAAIIEAPDLPWTVDDMARHTHTSRANFHRRFTLLAGIAPNQLLQHIRMRAACALLDRQGTVEAAAEATGYQSVAAFSRAFKRSLGMPPGAWRQRQRDVPSDEAAPS